MVQDKAEQEQGQIPTYQEAVAESLAETGRSSSGGSRHDTTVHHGGAASAPAGSTGYGVLAASPHPQAPHQAILIPHPHPHPHPLYPSATQPPVLLYSADPSAARRWALLRFLKAFMWAWLISILVAFLTGAIQVVDYDDDEGPGDWDGWKVTGIRILGRRAV